MVRAWSDYIGELNFNSWPTEAQKFVRTQFKLLVELETAMINMNDSINQASQLVEDGELTPEEVWYQDEMDEEC